eukprot:9504128-Pyramimonas_sp.AAC.1
MSLQNAHALVGWFTDPSYPSKRLRELQLTNPCNMCRDNCRLIDKPRLANTNTPYNTPHVILEAGATYATVPVHPGPFGRGYIGYSDEYDSALQENMGAPRCIAPLLCGQCLQAKYADKGTTCIIKGPPASTYVLSYYVSCITYS